MRIALVHDYLNQFGGAERVLSAFNEIYPEAPIYTSIYDAGKMPENYGRMEINPSFMQKLPFVFQFFKLYFPIYPLAFEGFDLSAFDVILSSSSAYAKGIKKNQEQLHICYCHTPMRFAWRYADYVDKEEFPAWIKSFLPYLLEPIKKWDLQNNRRVDYFIANSRNVARRIRENYGRESVIINPPVDCSLFNPSDVDRDYFLLVSRLNYYKRIDIVIEAFNALGLPLKIIGDGPARKLLEKSAHENIEFLGHLSDEKIVRLLAECRALIFPGEEDFGLVPLEAMASGRPVIAYKAGGAVETVIEGETGLFFSPQTAAALSEAINQFHFMPFNKGKIRERALQFDKEIFKRKIEEYVSEKYQQKYD